MNLFVLTSLAAIAAGGAAFMGIAAESKPPAASKLAVTTPLFADKLLAKGRGFEIKQSQLDEMYLSFKSHRAAMGVRVPDAMRPKIEADILEKLIATQLFLQLATETDRVKAKEVAEQFIAEQLKQVPSEESFNRQLLSVGMTPDQYRGQILEQAIVKAVIDREIKDKKTVTDAEIKAFYEKNSDKFRDPELVRVAHILIATQNPKTGQPLSNEQRVDKKRIADKILARAKAGEDFKALVGLFSEDPISKSRGGEYTITRATDDPSRSAVPEFEAAAFSLALNQVSDIVTTRFGFHIIKLLEKTPSRPLEFSALQSKIREKLLQDQVQKDLPAYIASMKKAADVQIVSPIAND